MQENRRTARGNGRYTEKVDSYSLGIILGEVITQRQSFKDPIKISINSITKDVNKPYSLELKERQELLEFVHYMVCFLRITPTKKSPFRATARHWTIVK